ncbi:MAG: cupin domain-containing protein, partial [Pseudonocardiaceae bacterium]
NTPQTPGMIRAAAVTHDRAGSEKLWAGTATIQPGAKTGAHHHGELESVIYVIRGRARMRWGDNLEFTAEAGPGGFIFVPPSVNTAYGAENTESPVTLAADPDSVTVGYLSRNGGNRRGPSIIAQYDHDGRLLRNVTVDGLVGRSAVSPNGRHLALEVSGSGGACVTVSRPVVVDLESLRVLLAWRPAFPHEWSSNDAR